MCGFLLNERPFVVHNKDTQFTGVVETWDGTNIATLRPGEVLELFFFYGSDGGGEAIAHIPERFAIAARGEDGTLSTPGYYEHSGDVLGACYRSSYDFSVFSFRFRRLPYRHGHMVERCRLERCQPGGFTIYHRGTKGRPVPIQEDGGN